MREESRNLPLLAFFTVVASSPNLSTFCFFGDKGTKKSANDEMTKTFFCIKREKSYLCIEKILVELVRLVKLVSQEL